MVDKNAENIKLIAKELTDTQETLATFDGRVTKLQTFMGENMTVTDRAFQDQSAQFKKLSQDLFDALSMQEKNSEFERRLEAQKVHYENLLNSIKTRIEEKLEAFDPTQARKDLQNFVYNTYNDRQEQIVQELMNYMQKLMSMNNIVNNQQPANNKPNSGINVMGEIVQGMQNTDQIKALQAQVKSHGERLNNIQYLREQLRGMIMLFVDFYDAYYFDLITETESPAVTTYRLAEMGESLMRHGVNLSETQLHTITSKIREKVSSG